MNSRAMIAEFPYDREETSFGRRQIKIHLHNRRTVVLSHSFSGQLSPGRLLHCPIPEPDNGLIWPNGIHKIPLCQK